MHVIEKLILLKYFNFLFQTWLIFLRKSFTPNIQTKNEFCIGIILTGVHVKSGIRKLVEIDKYATD